MKTRDREQERESRGAYVKRAPVPFASNFRLVKPELCATYVGFLAAERDELS